MLSCYPKGRNLDSHTSCFTLFHSSDVVDVSLSRIENDPIQKSLLIILESYNNENSGISLNNRFIPINELKEKLICNKKEAELFRQEFYSLIEKILLDNQEILLKKLRENFPEVIKKGKKKKIDNVS